MRGAGMRAYLDLAIEAMGAALMATMCVIVFLGVFFRYVLGDPLTWTEEIARLCLVWITFLGTYLAYRRSLHISIDVVRKRLSRSAQRIIHLIVLVLVGMFMTMLVIQGAHYSQAFLGSATPLLGVPLGLVYAALPICAALLLITILADFINFLRGRSPAHTDDAKGDVI
ncbi:MAG: TRAP transporter small permease [Betaproteobacteria bacterium]|nr:MAG: TRAP transporter small permease [Betaproteobacteria bacterium]